MATNDIDFIAQRYREGLFRPDSAWHRLGFVPSPRRRLQRIAAAVAVTAILSATAAIVYHEYGRVNSQPDTTVTDGATLPKEVKVIDFEQASLAEVVATIETVYDVKVDNVPEQTADYELSLHYEGTAEDLVNVINDILGTDMSVSEK
ncbi:MAG: hypothetical protein K2M55_01815 [Muribaculaceae bacterium]|nr:hypothetical protein [Muribaculaceae bacterium]